MPPPPTQALKLDIDNTPIELAFMERVGADPDLRARIGEIFFEQVGSRACGEWCGQISWDGCTAPCFFVVLPAEHPCALPVTMPS